MNPERLYRGSVRVLSVVFAVLGVAVLVATLAAGGGPLSTGFIMGLAFIAVGVARFWMTSRMGS